MTYWQYGSNKYDYRSAMYPKERDDLTPFIMERVEEFRDGLTNTDKATYNWTKSDLSKIIKNLIQLSSLTDDLFVIGNIKFFAKIIDIQDVKDHFRVYLKSFKYPKKKIITEIFAELPNKYPLNEDEKKTIVELTELLLHKY